MYVCSWNEIVLLLYITINCLTEFDDKLVSSPVKYRATVTEVILVIAAVCDDVIAVWLLTLWMGAIHENVNCDTGVISEMFHGNSTDNVTQTYPKSTFNFQLFKVQNVGSFDQQTGKLK